MSNDARDADPSTEAAPPSFRAAEHHEGQLIADKYRLLRRLGEGGMASVWVAHSETLDIEVAIKFIRADLQQSGLGSRLLQEARAAAKLGHPAIVRVSDFGKDAGQPYIVMELLRGEDLSKQILERGALPTVKAVRLLLPIAHALATAHDKGIVHRDLKPENIFLAEREGGGIQPKLVDFGIAKLKRDGDHRITQEGSMMGSPAYMSPEQARGHDVDSRTDVWALAVVLYECVTGKLPFEGTTYTALLCSILENAPRPISELGVADPHLWGVISRGLEKNPDARWSSMRELGTALAHWLSSRGVADDVTGSSLASTWLDPRPDSMRPPASLGGPARSAAVAQSAGELPTQLSFHDGKPPAPAPRRRKLGLLLAGAAGLVLLAGAALLIPKQGPAELASPPPTPEEPAPTTEIAPLVTEPPAEPPAVPPEVQPELPASAEVPEAEKPTRERPAQKGQAVRPTAKPKPAESQKPAAAAKPKSGGELDIKTTF
jgi:eukaryotic-like serine/threonine-protein kinase